MGLFGSSSLLFGVFMIDTFCRIQETEGWMGLISKSAEERIHDLVALEDLNKWVDVRRDVDWRTLQIDEGVASVCGCVL